MKITLGTIESFGNIVTKVNSETSRRCKKTLHGHIEKQMRGNLENQRLFQGGAGDLAPLKMN